MTRLESEISEYQKRIEQDAAAICTLEERLNNIVKRNREYDAEVSTLTQQNTGKFVLHYLVFQWVQGVKFSTF